MIPRNHSGRLRSPPKVLQVPTRLSGDFLALLDGGVYLVTSAPITADSGDSIIQAWDMTTEKCLASFEIRKEDTIMQWRSIEQGSAALFLIRDGLLSTDNGPQHYHLLRLDFTGGMYCSTQAKFSHNSSFVQELPTADISLSEDLVIILAVDTDNTVAMFLLQWRNGTTASIKTCISPPDDPYFTILSPNSLSIWVDSASSPYTYSYPLSEIYPHFSKRPQTPKYIPNPCRVNLHHIANAPPHYLANVTHVLRETTRKTERCGTRPVLANPLSILHMCIIQKAGPGPGPAAAAAAADTAGPRTLTCLAHEYRSPEFSAQPTSHRLYLAPADTPFAAASGSKLKPPPPPPQPQPHHQTTTTTTTTTTSSWPIGTSDPEAIIFPERHKKSGRLEMKFLLLPPDDSPERQRDPQWLSDHLVRSLEIPDELDLERVDIMVMVTSGAVITLAVAVHGGAIFILKY